MVETSRSAVANRPAAGEEEEKGTPASRAPVPAEDATAGPGAGDDAGSSQPPKRAKVASAEADTAKPSVAPAPSTVGLQALTGAMDKLEAILRSKEVQSNPAGHKRGTNDKDLSAKIKRAMDLSADLSAKIKRTKDKVAGIY